MLAPLLKEHPPGVELSRGSKGGLINLLSDGLEHPLLIVKKYAINMSTVSISNNLLGDLTRSQDQCARLITNLNQIATDPPYHPGLRLGEEASHCISLVPKEALQVEQRVDFTQVVAKRLMEIIQRGYKTTYKPNLFFGREDLDFQKKLKEHTNLEGDNIHYFLNIQGAKDCHFSNVLNTCLIHPHLVEDLESMQGEHDSILRSYERMLHEITHGLIHNLQGGQNILSYPLEEYIVTMATHQLTADFANEIAGEEIKPEEYRNFLVNGRISFLPPSHEQRKTVYFQNETRKYHKQIARYFMSKLNSKEGIDELNVLGE